MKRVSIQIGLMLVLLVMLNNARVTAQAPEPPTEPSDFSAYFVGFDYLALPHAKIVGPVSLDGLGFSNFGFWLPGIPGVITGDMFEDYTNERERFDIGSTDPHSVSPIATIWKFYDKGLIYLYRPATGKCTRSALDATLEPFWEGSEDASYTGQTGFATTTWYPNGIQDQGSGTLPGNIWTYPVSKYNSVEFATSTYTTQTPLYITRYAPGRMTRLQFTAFTSGQPDTSVFNLPAACVE